MRVQPPDTIEGAYVSTYFKFQTSISFSCQPHDLKVGFRAQKLAMHHNFETFLLLHNSKHTQAMSMKLLVTIVGLCLY